MVAGEQENCDKSVSGLNSQKTYKGAPATTAADMLQFRYRVLVVDDEPSICELARVFLEREGYEVLTAADGICGLEALSKSLPEVVISDLHMPRMSGVEFLAIIRKRFPNIATVAMSGDCITAADASDILADAFFQKGNFNFTELFREVASLIATPPIRPEREKSDNAPVFAPRKPAASDHPLPGATAAQL